MHWHIWIFTKRGMPLANRHVATPMTQMGMTNRQAWKPVKIKLSPARLLFKPRLIFVRVHADSWNARNNAGWICAGCFISFEVTVFY